MCIPLYDLGVFCCYEIVADGMLKSEWFFCVGSKSPRLSLNPEIAVNLHSLAAIGVFVRSKDMGFLITFYTVEECLHMLLYYTLHCMKKLQCGLSCARTGLVLAISTAMATLFPPLLTFVHGTVNNPAAPPNHVPEG